MGSNARWVIFSGVVVVGVAATVLAVAISEDGAPKLSTGAIDDEGPATRGDEVDALPTVVPRTQARDDKRAGVEPEHFARQASPEPHEDSVSAQWDELSPQRRRAHLERTFDTAIGQLEGGDDEVAIRVTVENALTGLRGELYATAEGRATHRRMEERYEKAIGDADRTKVTGR